MSAPLLIFLTALDTTWRMFVPILAGTFIGIGLDSWWHVAPVATVICLIIGVIISGALVIKQLTGVRKLQK